MTREEAIKFYRRNRFSLDEFDALKCVLSALDEYRKGSG